MPTTIPTGFLPRATCSGWPERYARIPQSGAFPIPETRRLDLGTLICPAATLPPPAAQRAARSGRHAPHPVARQDRHTPDPAPPLQAHQGSSRVPGLTLAPAEVGHEFAMGHLDLPGLPGRRQEVLGGEGQPHWSSRRTAEMSQKAGSRGVRWSFLTVIGKPTPGRNRSVLGCVCSTFRSRDPTLLRGRSTWAGIMRLPEYSRRSANAPLPRKDGTLDRRMDDRPVATVRCGD